MREEEKKVLASRWPFWRAWREKEWYFSCLHDPAAGVYLSWSFIRTFATDSFRFWALELDGQRGAWSGERRLFLDPGQRPGLLDLAGRGRGYEVSYTGLEEQPDRVRLHYRDDRHELELELLRRWPAFTRRDNTFVNHYTLLHHFGNEARGELRLDGRRFTVNTRRCYTDHCSGRVPRRTGWQWIAVQDERVALASLTNHGPCAQRYTQCWIDGRWVRLSEDVAFEYETTDLLAPWRVTSVDMDLQVRPRQVHRDHVQVPPGLGLLYDVHHNELFVDVEGRVRIDGAWRELDGLTGVAEEHYGRW